MTVAVYLVIMLFKLDALPVEVSMDCRSFIDGHLRLNTEERLGFYGSEEVLEHPFVGSLDFEALLTGDGPLLDLAVEGSGTDMQIGTEVCFNGPDENQGGADCSDDFIHFDYIDEMF